MRIVKPDGYEQPMLGGSLCFNTVSSSCITATGRFSRLQNKVVYTVLPNQNKVDQTVGFFPHINMAYQFF